MRRLIIAVTIVFIGISTQAQTLKDIVDSLELIANEQKSNINSGRYQITYISIDEEGWKPKHEYLTVKQSGNVYTIYYGGYSTFSLRFVKLIREEYYYYESEEGLLRVSSKVKLSDISKGIVSEGWLTISFECCLTEIIRFEKLDTKKK
jgi:hypothetical protein